MSLYTNCSSPYKFEAPWDSWEFANHVIHVEANLVILSMAWLTREDPRTYNQHPNEPDMETLSYWLARLEPIIRAESIGEIIVVLANRCGSEDDATYAGTSAVLGINEGEVKVYGILGRGEEQLLIVDTTEEPQAKLVSASLPGQDSTETPQSVMSDSSCSPASSIHASSASDEFTTSHDDTSPPASPIDPSERFESQEVQEGSQTQRLGEQSTTVDSRTHVQEPSPNTRSGISPSPHSASVALDPNASSITRSSLGPRSRHTSRPRSTMW